MTPTDLHLFNRRWKWILASFFMRFTGTLSFVGSAIIIYMILSDRLTKLKRIHNRFMLGMSTVEIFSSAAWIMSVSASPKDTIGSFGAAGNQATCTLQGFLFQLGIGVPFYNFSLCLYHCLVIRFNVSDATISKRLEPWLHAVSILFPLTTALAAIPMEMYNFKGAICYIEPSPWGCRYDQTCTRNSRSLVFEFWLHGFWLILIGCSLIVLMSLVYCSVRHRERAMSQFNFRTRDGTVVLSSSYVQLCKDKRETGIQALLYVSAFIITYICAGANYFFSVAHSNNAPPDALRFLIFLFQPLQGFWNFFIYIRPRYCLMTTQFRDKSFWAKLNLVIFHPEMGRRNSSLGSSRIQTRSAAATSNKTRLSLIHIKDVKQSLPNPNSIIKDVENSGEISENVSIRSSSHSEPSFESQTTLELSNDTQEVSVSESGFSNDKNPVKGPEVVFIKPSCIVDLAPESHPSYYRLGCVADETHSCVENTSHDMNCQSPRRASHIAISVDVEDYVIDDRYEVSQDDSQVRIPARRRRSLISIALEDEFQVDGPNELLPRERRNSPQRRRSFISISLEDVNEILAEDHGSLLEE